MDYGAGPSNSRLVGAVIATPISIRALSHGFDTGGVVLSNVDLTVQAGDFVALLGPSGCGKSTLLRLIAGLETPSDGQVELGGDAAATRAARRRMAFVFQDAHLLPWRSVLDNVALPLELQGVSKVEARQHAREPLGAVELSDVVARYPDQLSGGMRMRVSIARALVTRPELLLLDEPFAALDELTRQRLDERLRKLWLERGMTVVFVTHSLSEAAFLAERALVLSKRPGRVVLDRKLELPRNRPASLRTDLGFVQETSHLYDALARNDSLDPARP